MKATVDLTANRMFRNEQRVVDTILKSCLDKVGTKCPWNVAIFKHPTHVETKSLIFVGNKQHRQDLLYLYQMDSPDYCDCCGVHMNRVPWRKEYGICRTCHADYLTRNYDKVLWRKRQEINNADIFRYI